MNFDLAIKNELTVDSSLYIKRKDFMDLYFSFAEAYNLRKDNNGYGDFIAHVKKLYPTVRETRGPRPARELRYTGIGKKKSNHYPIKDEDFSAMGW